VVDRSRTSGWNSFWDRGGWWRALLLVVAYAVVYQGFGLLSGAVGRDFLAGGDLFAGPGSVFFGLAFPILLGGIALLAFVWSLNWLGEIFGPQPIRGGWWMWIAVALVVIPIVLRALGTEWSSYSVGVVLTTLLAGVFIGFAEELLTRGVAVNLLRHGGFGERAVMLLSSLLFAALHSVNVLTGQPLLTVAVTVVYTFGFGVMMYLVLRVTGSIIWPMLLHAATDPTTILATGGIDAHGDTAGSAGLISLAGLFNVVYVAAAIVALILVRGRVERENLAA
jgi:membrane protease YdiL (CAAX protease family)